MSILSHIDIYRDNADGHQDMGDVQLDRRPPVVGEGGWVGVGETG